MPKPNDFIISTDFATLGNDGTGSITVTVPSGVSVPGAGNVMYSNDIVLGKQGAIQYARISSSVDSKWRVANRVNYDRTGTVLGFPALYTIFVFVYRVSATTTRCQVLIQNPYSDTLTGTASETISFYVKTIVPPFS